jgi:hypothetical protein
MFKNLSELKSGKECDGFTLDSGADFRRDDRLFYWLFTLKHFVFLPVVEDMNDLLDDCFLDVIQKFF